MINKKVFKGLKDFVERKAFELVEEQGIYQSELKNQVLDDLRILEKDIDVLEIIKEKAVDIGCIKLSEDYLVYNTMRSVCINGELTKPEFNLIKEWLGK